MIRVLNSQDSNTGVFVAYSVGPQDTANVIGFLRRSAVRNSLARSGIANSPYVSVSGCCMSL